MHNKCNERNAHLKKNMKTTKKRIDLRNCIERLDDFVLYTEVLIQDRTGQIKEEDLVIIDATKDRPAEYLIYKLKKNE